MTHIQTFLSAKVAAGLSDKSISWYSWMLSRYAVYCAANNLDAHVPTSVEAFFVILRRDNQAPETVSSYYRALRVYFNWLVKRGLAEDNPLDVVDKPRIPRQRKRHITIAEFRLLYESIPEHDWTDYRDMAMLIILFYSGVRVGELVALDRADVDVSRRLITVRHGKGGHERIVPCAPSLSEPYLRYLYMRPAWNRPGLWLSNDGVGGLRGRLTAEGVRMMLRRRCKAAGLRYVNPHQFRHGFAMTLLNAGMELSAVSAAMGHSSQSVTEQVYAAWLTDGLAREYAEALRKLGV